MRRIVIFSVLLSLITLSGNSQINELPDSIAVPLDRITSDSAKVAYLLGLFPVYIRENTDLTAHILAKAKDIVNRSDNHQFERDIDIKMGITYVYQNQLDTARTIFEMVLEDAKAAEDSAQMATIISEIGITYYYQSNDSKALDYFVQAYFILKDLGDTARLGGISNNIGIMFDSFEEFDKAKPYFFEAIKYKLHMGDSSRLGSSYHNLAIAYEELGEFDSALYYLNIATGLRLKFNDLRGLTKSYGSIGLVHLHRQQYDSAHYYYEKAVNLDKQIKDTIALSSDLTSFAEVLFFQSKYQEAKKMVLSSLSMTRDVETKKASYKILGDIAEKLGDFKVSAESRKQYYEISDSISAAENKAELSELRVSFETELKDLRISELESERQLQELKAQQAERQQLYLLIGLTLLSIIIAVIVLLYRAKVKSNKSLEMVNQQLASLNQTKNRLFSIISHDLKSPLSSFHLITKSLTENWDNLEKDQLKDFLITLRESSANVRDMMDNLLKWALAQTDQLQYDPESLNPVEIIDGVKSQLLSVAQLKETEIHIQQEESLKIEADRAFLEIIVRNLISNALKYSDVQKRIDVLISGEDNCGVIEVKDQGVGMDQEQVDKLLSGNLVAHDIQNSSEKGTGLGLMLCKELVQRMNGSIEVSSKRNEGTIFRISFPKAA
ncbi:tetratricopeptide repeat-containing sensor histidine kinase [Marinoscillum pacificum]|uniref:tetratricopeptide repeat-containing sensor histidine kinase n=1 Tax=Marinoscillum pacificum TaxID=392723 RepID=UPI002157ECB5|nr:tetratricopeptide repeat-containing sensor histidine kinase [Marinoscillum pacificum]